MAQFTLSSGGGGGSLSFRRTNFERVVRPSVIIESFLKDRTPKPVEIPEQEAEIRWGKASTFQWSSTNPPNTGGGGITVRPGDDEDDEEIGSQTVEFEETARSIHVVRVSNPLDDQQYVDVERIDDITFRAPAELLSALTALRDGSITELLYKYILHFEE